MSEENSARPTFERARWQMVLLEELARKWASVLAHVFPEPPTTDMIQEWLVEIEGLDLRTSGEQQFEMLCRLKDYLADWLARHFAAKVHGHMLSPQQANFRDWIDEVGLDHPGWFEHVQHRAREFMGAE